MKVVYTSESISGYLYTLTKNKVYDAKVVTGISISIKDDNGVHILVGYLDKLNPSFITLEDYRNKVINEILTK